ncbi:MAG: DUF2752 domain-containing protein [Williamsia sp.]|nr:DUF2752 domain-containing protein [Williamsia sp.]
MKFNVRYQFFFVAIAVIILSLLYFFYPANISHFYPACPFHQLTGLFCPGCGSQRATSSLLHGRLFQAADYNLLFVLSLPLVLYAAFVFSWNSFSSRKIEQKVFHSVLFTKLFFVAVVLFGILRNLPFFPFSWLAP